MRPEPHYTAKEYSLLFQQGDEQGLAFFYLEFHAALSLYAYRFVQNRAIAEEIASDAFLKTWKKNYKLDSYNGIKAYLYKTVQRDCYHAVKRERKRNEVHLKAQSGVAINETPYHNIIRSEVYRAIHTALEELSPGSRRVMIMHYLEGKTTGQIAKELHLSPSTIKTQKTKGLEALRKKILRPLLSLFPLL